MRSSSASATASHSCSRAASAAALYSSGMSNSVCVVPSQWRAFMRTTSMTPSKASPVPHGRVTAPRRMPKRSRSCSMQVS